MFTFILEECSKLNINKTIRRPNWGCWSAPWTFSGFSYGSLCFCYYSCTYVSPRKFDITIAARNTKSTSSPITNVKFANIKQMNKHYLSDHTKRQHAGDGSNSFVCHMCYARKPNSYLLKKRMQQHVESVCKVCEKQFNLTKNSKRHWKVHKVQRCKDCGIYFNAKKDLRNHKLQVHARRKSKKDDPFAAIEDAEFVLA